MRTIIEKFMEKFLNEDNQTYKVNELLSILKIHPGQTFCSEYHKEVAGKNISDIYILVGTNDKEIILQKSDLSEGEFVVEPLWFLNRKINSEILLIDIL